MTPARPALRLAAVTDWSAYPNFDEYEFRCRHTGRCLMRAEFLDVLQAIRTEFGRPMVITSGYRDPSHPQEVGKTIPGEHTLGTAADIAVSGAAAMDLLRIALAHRVPRIGIKQHGPGRFIHLGLGGPGLPTPAVWTY